MKLKNNPKSNPAIENNSQERYKIKKLFVPTADDFIYEEAKQFWDGDSEFDHYDRTLAVQFFNHILSIYN